MKLAKLLILSTCLMGFSTALHAQNCNIAPSCDSLGYTYSESDCAGKYFLRCPFNRNAVYCGGKDCPAEVDCLGAECKTYCENKCIECILPAKSEIFDGRGNTTKIIAQIGTNGLAAAACNQFYPPNISSTDASFGAGKWYLPAIGELVRMFGLDISAVTSGSGDSGADKSKGLTIINTQIEVAGGSEMSGRYYWSSTEYPDTYNNPPRGFYAWYFFIGTGQRSGCNKNDANQVRCFQTLEGFVPSGTPSPQIGDIVYSDKSWSTALETSKKPVGVITDVYGSDITIVNLKDLTFSSSSAVGNFDAANPYNNTVGTTHWAAGSYFAEDITTTTNYDPNALKAALQAHKYW